MSNCYRLVFGDPHAQDDLDTDSRSSPSSRVTPYPRHHQNGHAYKASEAVREILNRRSCVEAASDHTGNTLDFDATPPTTVMESFTDRQLPPSGSLTRTCSPNPHARDSFASSEEDFGQPRAASPRSSEVSSRSSSAGRLRLDTYITAGDSQTGTPTEVTSPDMDYTIGSGSLDTKEVEELLRYEPRLRRDRTRIPSAKRDGSRHSRELSAGSQGDGQSDSEGDPKLRYKYHVSRENLNSSSSQTPDNRLHKSNNLQNGLQAGNVKQINTQAQLYGSGAQIFTQEEVNEKLKALELDFQNKLKDDTKCDDVDGGHGPKVTTVKTKSLEEENGRLRREADEMKRCMAEYEVTIQQLMRDKEVLKSGKSDEVQEALKERDSAMEELNSVERSFSDLHRRYEKTKLLIEGFKKNEESLKRVAEEWQQGLKKEQERYKALKAHAEEKLELANKTIDREKRRSLNEVAGLQAALRKSEIKCSNLEKALEAKVKENEELTTICDELIAKVGKP